MISRFGQPWSAFREVLRRPPRRENSSESYRFSFYDAWLYCLARRWKAPAIRKVAEAEAGIGVYEIDGVQFCWPADATPDSLPYIFAEVFERPFANPHAYEWGACRIRGGDHVVDAGACEGFFSICALGRGAGHVSAVEPVPELVRALERTFARSGRERVTVIDGLLGRVSGEAYLAPDVADLCMAQKGEASSGRAVEEHALDDLVEAGRVSRVDFLKADVEGAELDVVAGAVESIRRFRPRVSLAVYHTPSQAREVREYCEGTFERYRWRYRGLYGWEAEPRPYMLYGWPETG